MTKKNNELVEMDLSSLKSGESKVLSNINGNYVLSELDNGFIDINGALNLAAYDFDKSEHLYSKIIKEEYKTYVVTQEDLDNLAKNTQNDIDKIIKINGLVQYYMNKDDLMGKVVEIIENNVNTKYTLEYPNVQAKKINKRKKQNVETIINKFNENIDIKELIIKNAVLTYTEGNYIPYLRGDIDSGYSIESYPLGLIKISDYEYAGEPVVLMDIEKLKSKLKGKDELRKLKAKTPFKIPESAEEEVKNTYPEEVYSAYIVKDKYCILNPQRVGVSRVNNLRGIYGVSPMFKALNSQLMLETCDKVDRKNVIAKSKKIYHQKLRKEVLGQNLEKVKHSNEITYAHATLLNAMSKDVVIVTTPGYVESIDILEPQTDTIKTETILGYRNRVLNALGIAFISNESKSSYNSISVNVEELLKTINKITAQIEKIINKYYKVICVENGIEISYAPKINIQSTQYINTDSLNKLVDLLYSKIGVSYKTIFNMLGLDYQTEVQNRIDENEFEYNGEILDLDGIFSPHTNSYTSNSNDLINKGKDESNRKEENQAKDKDQQNLNKKIEENKVD